MARRIESKTGAIVIHTGSASKDALDRERRLAKRQRKEERRISLALQLEPISPNEQPQFKFTLAPNGALIPEE